MLVVGIHYSCKWHPISYFRIFKSSSFQWQRKASTMRSLKHMGQGITETLKGTLNKIENTLLTLENI